LRSQLSTERNYTGPITDASDPRGSWRVVLHWLVDAGAKEEWTEQIMAVRRETAFSEELSFDAILLTAGNIKTQIEEYGFPRLLITTREVLKKQRLEEMTHWLSANKLVEEALSDFAANFHKPDQREIANDVIQAMQGFRGNPNIATDGAKSPAKPKTIRSIRIRDFRNLQNVQFDFGIDPVSTSVIYGPNGTGKSSLCEAISITLFQSSFRYKWFADRNREKDVTATNRASEYLGNYLTPLEKQQAAPGIALDGNDFTSPQLVNPDETEEKDLAMGGTILTQDTSLEFARMSAHELGARVLRGYSELADYVEEFVESRVSQANTKRQDFLRMLGLSASITKVDTAYNRIARREIDQSLPPFPNALVTWLETAGKLSSDSGNDLPQRWRAWGEDASRSELAATVANLNNDQKKFARDIREWLQRFNELALGSTELVKNIESRLGSIRHELENAAAQITVWGEWLERRTQIPTNTVLPEADALAKKLHEFQAHQKQVIERGRIAGGHFDHLTQVEAYVRENWSKQHPDDCPTCGTNHSAHGGILKVVESLRAKTAGEREQLREEYTKFKTEIDQAQKRLNELGYAQCPLGIEEQSNLAEALQWFIPANSNFSEWIGVKAQRDILLASIGILRQIPSVPAALKAETESERVAQRLFSQFREADKIFDAPTNWKPVKDKLTETLAEIVNKHLPNTLTKLWLELTLNLTSAPWLLPERPSIDVVTRRGEQKSTLRVKGRLARYILNQAEIHTLGLAWFFTRYLTRGRFFHACMVMDDPAHELDQTSYRDLCRLLETVMRLHRVYSRPLKLIVMLNQENRAVEAARATGGILTVLDWERDQKKAMNLISVVGEGFHAPQPTTLFAKAE
jgi:energy-coupling factor transporter ATP-binding protein EcfA2